ncbi:MAG: hypothetical protein A2046_01950 [Bacteroidetes bacterium GWA2_30_7]|nr:MAG: hypothetical protein A2046_01950 [Bacteroidetes bacterium GWA2_30_7]
MNWICPTCKRTFKHENQQHSCKIISLPELLENKNENVIKVFSQLRSFLLSLDNVIENPLRNNILYSSKAIFASIKLKKSYIDFEFFLNNEIDEFPVYKTLKISKNRIVHFVKIETNENIDEQLMNWITQSYELVNK